MSVQFKADSNDKVGIKEFNTEGQTILSSSTPRTDSLSIDFILVYDQTNQIKHDTLDDDHSQQRIYETPAELRKKFEDYLCRKQGIILNREESTFDRIGYVKVHTPFDVLLVTAENMRMRLPIEKIEENENDSLNYNKVQSTWHRFMKWVKKPFRLEASLEQNDPDYYTAIYSSNIDRFQYLFDELRGSRDLYFTSTERSLLTYELLSRINFDSISDEDNSETITTESMPNPNMKLGSSQKRPGIDKLIAKGAYERYFPLHEPLRENLNGINDSELNNRERLRKYWATMRRCFKFQPLSIIRSYMGEKIAFYFALCGFYNQMLIPPALVGFIIFIYGISTVFTDKPTSDICGVFGQTTNMCPRCDRTCPFWKLSDSCLYSKISYVFDNTATLIFSILMSLWARWFIEFWKRRQAFLQYDWDSIDFEKHLEPIRPEFENKAKKKGEERINPVTGIKEPYISARVRMPFFLISAIVVLVMMCIVCLTVFGTIAYRVQMDFILKKTNLRVYSSIIITVTSAIINLIFSVILSQLYYWIARRLTDFEMHKYQSKYDDSLIVKIYLFQFVNFYSSLFYIAFFKGRFLEYPSKYGESGSGDFTEQCDPSGCLVELSIQFIIIMIGKQMINNLLEFFNAMRSTLAGLCCRRVSPQREKQWEIDNRLYSFNSRILTDEYLELVIQYGFVTLFVAAFPLAPLFALMNNIIEIRLDAWKFLSKYKRPIPFKASDIGIWKDIISGISHFAVLTNAVVIAWTSEFIPKMMYRSMTSTGSSLEGYVNWTLSTFSVNDYNLTNTLPLSIPDNVTFCRYRDFREQTGPYYYQTSVYWNVTAARLAFIIVFEHFVFFIIYLMQWLVHDVPKKIQDKIDHERYIDQLERWASKTAEDHMKQAIVASRVISRITNEINGNLTLRTDQAQRNRDRLVNHRTEMHVDLPNNN